MKSYLTEEAIAMDNSFINNPLFQSIPPEKQAFLKNFAAQTPSDNPNDLANQLSSAAMSAKSQGLSFSEAETTLLINMLKQNMSPAEQQKADRIIQLAKTFRPH